MAGIKIRAKEKDGIVYVKALMRHAMETGTRKDKKTGELIPAHYIQEVTVRHGDDVVMAANWGAAVSKNPYLAFKFKGGVKGDSLTLSWVDNRGQTESKNAVIK